MRGPKATHYLCRDIKRFKFFRKIFGKSKHKNYICSEKENNTMRIISKSTLIEYYTKEPKAICHTVPGTVCLNDKMII